MSINTSKLVGLVILLLVVSGCEKGTKVNNSQAVTTAYEYSSIPDYYTELYRPQYHLSPESGNMSDPNGMVYFAGEYHQFYQNSGQWGHAVSTDLIHWKHLPVALLRDSLGEIWSGSVVVDWKDSSGFFGGKPGLVAIFTHFKGGTQSQSLAYSSDKGRTWTKYEGNPVIPNPGLKDFRDPKVLWHGPSKSWIMVVSVDNKVRFYTSQDLKKWEMTSEFGADQGSHAAVWECPDLFELPVEGSRETKWVLALSIGNNAVTKGSTAQYFIGSFDGKTFKNDNEASKILWTDYGKDFYAAVSYSDIPQADGRRIYVGWMSNWRYPFTMPTDPWKGNMSLPRELKLRDIPGEGLRLVQQPVEELETLRGKPVELGTQQLEQGKNPLSEVRGTSYELDAEFTVQVEAEFGFKLRKGGEQETVVSYNSVTSTLTVDRTKSGDSSFEAGFAEAVQAPLRAVNGKIKLRIFVDESTLEVFGADGETVLSSILFPDATSNGLELFLGHGEVTLDQAVCYPLAGVWRDEALEGTEPLRILLNKSSIDVPLGESVTAIAAVIPLTAPQELTWVSSDETVAKVQSAGGTTALVKGLGEGQTEIKALTPGGKVKAVMTVFVYNPD
ncbi:GH32 C-terminal domain-containing protein [Paenibacillus sp. 19GGS1-52]|uniref:glycoside hydrolase family 32 protein n=1 Tax=Paenibacillus sp. 19GGS1-52 TaxID=2758563 RepID=UPI001EFBCC96|nr:glycoside hydrolase family 32 protein [Paenibacillus sp. 19GGS1-52]ULO05781.1 GH32 C-terminal domain-containing protein [Paenibacillus sp. 19GGS1-52]